MNGIRHIGAVFAAVRAEGRAALMPYLTLGYPSPEVTPSLVEAVASAGADMLELGIPFSDPLADGPTIQHAVHVALQQGTTVARCLAMVEEVRKRGVDVPLILMSYYNPILAYGEADFCRACREVGADGLIVPDLPPEEGESLEAACRSQGLALVYLVAPTSTPARVRMIAGRTEGFLYLVSVAGTTGARDRLPPDLTAFVERVRAVSAGPLAVGFGISTPEQARAVGSLADGVIVGSALIRAVRDGGAGAAVTFVSGLRRALNGCRSARS